MMTAGELCVRDVYTCDPAETAAAAARRMLEHHIGCLIVVEQRHGRTVPLGMLTDRDVAVCLVAADVRDPRSLRVADVMSSPAVVAHEADSLVAALWRMRAHGVRRLPIVDEWGALAGLVTFDDLLTQIADELTDLVRLLGREQRRERGELPGVASGVVGVH